MQGQYEKGLCPAVQSYIVTLPREALIMYVKILIYNQSKALVFNQKNVQHKTMAGTVDNVIVLFAQNCDIKSSQISQLTYSMIYLTSWLSFAKSSQVSDNKGTILTHQSGLLIGGYSQGDKDVITKESME